MLFGEVGGVPRQPFSAVDAVRMSWQRRENPGVLKDEFKKRCFGDA